MKDTNIPVEKYRITLEDAYRDIAPDIRAMLSRSDLRHFVNGWNTFVNTNLSQAIQAAVEEERTSHRVRVGMLRQWLNEDRITDTSKMVTNEDIEYWLSIINKHQ